MVESDYGAGSANATNMPPAGRPDLPPPASTVEGAEEADEGQDQNNADGCVLPSGDEGATDSETLPKRRRSTRRPALETLD